MMQIELDEKPLGRPIIIEGFPGFGFVSTIATEFLIKHLEAKSIGRIVSEKLSPVATIHKSNVLNPLEIFYDKKRNIIIVQAITSVENLEWEIAETIIEFAKEVKAKEIISFEGVNSKGDAKIPNVFFYSNREENKKKMRSMSFLPLDEGIIIGVTGVLLLRIQDIPFSCFFVETHSELPDNIGAAKLVETIDKYLKLDVDYRPLIERAKEFEMKLKNLMSKLGESKEIKEKKNLAYMG